MYFLFNKDTAKYVKVVLSEAVLNTACFLPILFKKKKGDSTEQSYCQYQHAAHLLSMF